MQCIYKRPQGNKLLNKRYHPEIIKAYLREEAIQITQRASDFEVMVELGCSSGRYAGLARRLGLRYVGVDKEVRYLRQARRRYPKVNLLKSVVNEALFHRLYNQYSTAKVLLVLPFNLLGILPEPEAFVQCFTGTAKNWGLLISLFQAGREATAVRRKYYASAGLRPLQHTQTEAGVLFWSKGGFASTAFREQWLAYILFPLNHPAMEFCTFRRIAAFYYKPATR